MPGARLTAWTIVLLIIWGCALAAVPASASDADTTLSQPASQVDGTIPTEDGAASALIISEFMADNESTIRDEDGDAPDWIEIQNIGDSVVNLAGYGLTDSPNNLRKWTFPSYWLEPGNQLLVFASDKNRTDPARQLHTNFALQRSGEYLALVSPAGLVVDSYGHSYPPQYADVAYGVDALGYRRYLSVPTPGFSNDVAGNAGPVIIGTVQRPALVNPDDELRVITVVRPGRNPVFSVELRYRVLYGPEATMSMGLENVDSNGNLIYSAIIPRTAYGVGEMVRYYSIAFDTQGLYTRWPLIGNPDDSPYYFGTVINDPTVDDDVPTLHWFLRDPAAAETRTGTRATVFFDGKLYDNVFVRTRGKAAMSRAKKSFKFEFNDGYELYIGALNTTVDEINVNTNLDDQSYIRQILSWEAFRAAGSPYSFAFPLRVQQNGQFFGLFTMIEQPDGDYFVRNGLDYEGALYKVDANTLAGGTDGLEKRTREDEDLGDILALIDGVHLEGEAREAFLFDNINVPAVLNFLAISHVIQDWDFVSHNHYLYRDTRNTGEWMFIPWDKDLTFGTVAENGVNNHPLHGTQAYPAHFLDRGQTEFNHLIDALLNTPRIRAMYLRRLRSVSDLLLQPPDTPTQERFFEPRMDELATQLADVAAADAQKWGTPSDFAAAIDWMKVQSLDVKRRHLYGTLSVAAEGIFPAGGQDDTRIYVKTINHDVPGQAPESEYFVLHNSSGEAVDISGWYVTGAIEYTFQPGTVITSGDSLFVTKNVASFRARTTSPRGGEGLFVQGGYKGRMNDSGGAFGLYTADGRPLLAAQFGPGIWNKEYVFLPIAGQVGRSTPPFPQLTDGRFDMPSIASWVKSSSLDQPLVYPEDAVARDLEEDFVAHSSPNLAWLGGALSELATLHQSVRLSDEHPDVRLSFWHWIDSSETDCGDDRAYVEVDATTVITFDLCQANNTDGWQRVDVGLTEHATGTVAVRFRSLQDDAEVSNWFLDDVTLCDGTSAHPCE